MALQGGRIHSFGRRLLVPLGRGRVEASGHCLRRYTRGQLEWEQDLGRDEGPIVGLDLLDLDGDGRQEIVAVQQHGRLEALDQHGRRVCGLHLRRGRIDMALCFEDGRAGQYLVSAFCRQGRRRPWSKESGPGWVTFVVAEGRVVDTRLGIGLRARVGLSSYLTLDWQEWAVHGQHKLKGLEAKGNNGRHKVLVPDLRDRERSLVAWADTAQHRLSLETLSGEELWTRPLPSAATGVYPLGGVLGSAGTAGQGLLALLFEAWHTEVRFHTRIGQKHLWLLRQDGNMIGTCHYPPGLSQWVNAPILLLEDVDQDGQAEVLVIEDEAVRVWGLSGNRCLPGRE